MSQSSEQEPMTKQQREALVKALVRLMREQERRDERLKRLRGDSENR